MNEKSINQNPTPWKEKNENFVKIASLNCMNLNNTYKDIVSDRTLLESTLLALSETWLLEETGLDITF